MAVWSRSNLAEILPERMMPFTEAVACETFNCAFARQYASYGIRLDPESEPLVRTFSGTGYMNMTLLGDLARRVWGSDPEVVARYMGGAVPQSFGDGAPHGPAHRGLTIARAMVAGSRALVRLRQRERDGQARRKERLAGQAVGNPPELADARAALIDVAVDHMHIGTLATAALSVLQQRAERRGRNDAIGVEALDLAAAPNVDRQHRLWKLKELAALRGLGDLEVRAAALGFLEDHGHRGLYEMDAAHPRPIDDPDAFIAGLAVHVGKGAQGAAALPRAGLPQERSALAQLTRRLLVAREQSKSVLAMSVHDLRQAVLAAAARVVDIIGDPSDAFWLLPGELERVGRSKLPTVRVLLRARTQRDLGPPPPQTRQDDAEATPVADGGSRGIAVSLGTVEGQVRILRSPSDMDNLRKGEIAVVAALDSGWSAVFQHAGGVLTETGGVISHAALLLRECGIPAIFNCSNALNRFRTGERIRIHATPDAPSVTWIPSEGASAD